jgi:DNA polymerase alpha subunit A
MPQVQVALRELSRGKTVRVNDVMSYIVTGDSKNTSESAAKRAYTLQDVLKPDSDLKPDIEYYLLKQIFPPIERLCAPISGTDPVRLAECLGLDTRKYQINTSTHQGTQNAEITPLESQIADSIRFANATRFTLRCRACKTLSTFEGISQSSNMVTATGLICPNTSCENPFTTISIAAQLEFQIRHQTATYYSAYLVCDDPACGNRTRSMSVYGHRCLGPRGRAEGCMGKMGYEYTEKSLYNQLLYYASLFDVEKMKDGEVVKGLSADEKEKVRVVAEHNRLRFGTLKGVVESYLRRCGRQWVEMDLLFGFALK